MSTGKSVVKGVAEIVLNVHDIDKMRRFYEQVIGFEFHSQFPEDNPTIIFLTIKEQDSPLARGGHPQIFGLVDPERHMFRRSGFAGLDVSRSSLNHLALEIDRSDFESELERLESLGLEVSTVAFPRLNAIGLFFEDPERNLIEFICHDGSMESAASEANR